MGAGGGTGAGADGGTGTGTGGGADAGAGAGDGGAASARPYFPAFIPQVVAVEDYGPDGARPKNAPAVFATDLAAPGDAVVSAGPKGPGHFIGSGSSLAAAFVAGTAALVRAYQPRLTAAEVANLLVVSAYPAGAPILDPYAAVAAVPSRTGTPPTPATAVRMPGRDSRTPRTRALIIASVGGGIVALVAMAAAIIPHGRARGWRPAHDRTMDPLRPTAADPQPADDPTTDPRRPTAPDQQPADDHTA
jgi:membrane-anchored mycosin MYCP